MSRKGTVGVGQAAQIEFTSWSEQGYQALLSRRALRRRELGEQPFLKTLATEIRRFSTRVATPRPLRCQTPTFREGQQGNVTNTARKTAGTAPIDSRHYLSSASWIFDMYF